MATVAFTTMTRPQPTASTGAVLRLSLDAVDLRRIAVGDDGALADLYDRHSAMAYGLALRVTNDHALAEDVVQETFVSVWRGASTFDEVKASARTWILTIAHRRAVDAVRRRRQPVVSLEVEEGDAPVRLPFTPDVWGEVSQRLDSATVRGALAKLPAAQRRAIELAYFDGLTQHEIAAATGVPLGTVKGRVRLGLSRLRELLPSAEGTREAVVPAA